MEKREHSLDVLQDKVMKLKEYAKLQKTPLQMQVNAIKREFKQIYQHSCNEISFSPLQITCTKLVKHQLIVII